MTVDVREVFSKNLRELCDERPSVSAVCRDLSINRQQFARYLSGNALPSKDNLARICEYFGIVEGVLFDLNGLVDRTSRSSVDNAIGARVLDILTDESQARMPEGAYWCDYASPMFPQQIVRAVMLVKQQDRCTTFRRLTGFGEKKDSWWYDFRGDHEGIVVERRGMFFFTAINTNWAGRTKHVDYGARPRSRFHSIRNCHNYGDGRPGCDGCGNFSSTKIAFTAQGPSPIKRL